MNPMQNPSKYHRHSNIRHSSHSTVLSSSPPSSSPSIESDTLIDTLKISLSEMSMSAAPTSHNQQQQIFTYSSSAMTNMSIPASPSLHASKGVPFSDNDDANWLLDDQCQDHDQDQGFNHHHVPKFSNDDHHHNKKRKRELDHDMLSSSSSLSAFPSLSSSLTPSTPPPSASSVTSATSATSSSTVTKRQKRLPKESKSRLRRHRHPAIITKPASSHNQPSPLTLNIDCQLSSSTLPSSDFLSSDFDVPVAFGLEDDHQVWETEEEKQQEEKEEEDVTTITTTTSFHPPPLGTLAVFPVEVVFNIFAFLDGKDIGRLEQLNKTYRDFLRNTPYLWKQLYHRLLTIQESHYNSLSNFVALNSSSSSRVHLELFPREGKHPISVPVLPDHHHHNHNHHHYQPATILEKLSARDVRLLYIEAQTFFNDPTKCFVCQANFDGHYAGSRSSDAITFVRDWGIRICEPCSVFQLIHESNVCQEYLLSKPDMKRLTPWVTSLPNVDDIYATMEDVFESFEEHTQDLPADQALKGKVFYFRPQCLALALEEHGDLESFQSAISEHESHIADKSVQQQSFRDQQRHEREIAVLNKLVSMGIIQSKFTELHHPTIPKSIVKELQDYIETGYIGDETNTESKLISNFQTLSFTLPARLRYEQLVSRIAAMYPDYCDEGVIEKCRAIPAFYELVYSPTDNYVDVGFFGDEDLVLDYEMNRVAVLIIQEVRLRDTFHNMVQSRLVEVYPTLEPQPTLLHEDFIKQGMNYIRHQIGLEKESFINADINKLVDMVIDRYLNHQRKKSPPQPDLPNGVNPNEPSPQLQSQRQHILDNAIHRHSPDIAKIILPMTAESDPTLYQIYSSFIRSSSFCDSHLTTCLRKCLGDLVRRCRVLRNMAFLNMELKKLFDAEFIPGKTLRTDYAKEEYERIVKLNLVHEPVESDDEETETPFPTNRYQYSLMARYLYRTEILTRGLQQLFPSWSLDTCSSHSMELYQRYTHSYNDPIERPANYYGPLPVPDHLVHLYYNVTTIKLHTALELGLPLTPWYEEVLKQIFECESIRLQRIGKLVSEVKKRKLDFVETKKAVDEEDDDDEAKGQEHIQHVPYAIITLDELTRPEIIGLTYSEVVREIPNISVQYLLETWVYDETYPSVSELEIALCHAKRLQEKTRRVEQVRRMIRNDDRYQGLFEDAYEKHDFLKSFFMECAYRSCPEYLAYVECVAGEAVLVEGIVEKLVDFVVALKKGKISKDACLAMYAFFQSTVRGGGDDDDDEDGVEE